MEGISNNPSKFDKVKHSLADRIHNAADSMRRKSDSMENGSISNYGHQASSFLDRSAEYIHDFDIQRADAQIRHEIQINPGRSLLVAAAVGLLLGIWLRRR